MSSNTREAYHSDDCNRHELMATVPMAWRARGHRLLKGAIPTSAEQDIDWEQVKRAAACFVVANELGRP